jgi:hypothetical protein
MIKLQSSIESFDESDAYYYHITLAPYVSQIKHNGLLVGSKSTVSNYIQHSRGKIFFCDSGMVDKWTWIIGSHAFHEHDDERFHDVAIFRVLKNKLQNVNPDDLGTRDSGGPAYYVTYDIPPEILEFVKVVESPY